VLNAHSHIYCGPEVKFFRDFYGDYFHDPVHHLRFTTTARTLLPEAELLDLLGDTFVRIHEAAAARAGKPRWADKNPENVLYLRQWEQLLGERWIFVHVVRNPLDTMASIKEMRFPLSLPSSLQERIAVYRNYTQAGLNFGAVHPERYHRVVYERLVSDAAPTLRGLMRSLGEAMESGQMMFNCVAQQTGLEDPKIAHTSGIHSKSVGRWQAILTADEAHEVWEASHDLWTQVDPDSGKGVEVLVTQ
jgi:hypothetical protein